jgi:hypothetical protein
MRYCKVSRYKDTVVPDPKNPAAKVTRRELVPVKRHLTWDEAKAACHSDRSLEIGTDCAPPVDEFQEVAAAIL